MEESFRLQQVRVVRALMKQKRQVRSLSCFLLFNIISNSLVPAAPIVTSLLLLLWDFWSPNASAGAQQSLHAQSESYMEPCWRSDSKDFLLFCPPFASGQHRKCSSPSECLCDRKYWGSRGDWNLTIIFEIKDSLDFLVFCKTFKYHFPPSLSV